MERVISCGVWDYCAEALKIMKLTSSLHGRLHCATGHDNTGTSTSHILGGFFSDAAVSTGDQNSFAIHPNLYLQNKKHF